MSNRRKYETIETYRYNNVCKNCKNTYYLENVGYVIKCRHDLTGCRPNEATHFAYRKPGEEIIKPDVI